MEVIKLVIVLVLWVVLMRWVFKGSRAQGRARVVMIMGAMFVLMALGVKF